VAHADTRAGADAALPRRDNEAHPKETTDEVLGFISGIFPFSENVLARVGRDPVLALLWGFEVLLVVVLVVTLALGRLLPEMQLAIVTLVVVTLAVTLLVSLWRFVPSVRPAVDVPMHRRTLRNTAASAGEHPRRARALGTASQQGCNEILLALRETISGLEGEYDEILVQARACISDPQGSIESLLSRVDEMLDSEIVRPKMLEAIGLLANCAQGGDVELGKRLAELQSDLREYRDSLGDSGSGPNYTALGRFRTQLRELWLERRLSPKALVLMIEELQSTRTKETPNRIHERIGRLVNR